MNSAYLLNKQNIKIAELRQSVSEYQQSLTTIRDRCRFLKQQLNRRDERIAALLDQLADLQLLLVDK